MNLIEHIQKAGKDPASVQKQWRRKEAAMLITRPFRRDLVPTQEELSLVLGERQKRTVKAFVQTDRQPVTVSTPKTPDIQTKTTDKKRTKYRTLILWVVALVCAAVSVSNMYDISGQIKTSTPDAALITALFSLAPFAMLYAGVSRLASWLVSGICIGFEVFCNTAGMYRGLAGLGRSGKPYEVWTEGGFIDTVSRVTTLEARPCALLISVGMAAIVAAVFLTCLIELKR